MRTPAKRTGGLVLALALLGAALGACGTSDSGLTGETWAVTAARAAGDDISSATWIRAGQAGNYTVRFDANGTLTGKADCNSIAGTFKLSGRDQLSITLGPSTQMACPNDPAGQVFAAALAKTATYAVPSSGHLTLTLAGGGSIDFVPLLSLPTPDPSASAAPSGTSSAAPPSPTPSPSPSAPATPKPSATRSPSPTPAPTAAPSAPASATPGASPVTLGPSCTAAGGGVVVSYPETWQTVGDDVPQFACAVFDRVPIVIDPVTGMPQNGPVRVVQLPTVTYTDVVTAITNPTTWTQVRTTPATVAGLPATLVAAVASDGGSVPAGTLAYTYVVDRGPLGVLLIDTTAKEGDPAASSNEAVVDAMAAAVLLKATR